MQNKNMNIDQVSTDLFKHWIHSQEDDDNKANISVFRPSNFQFPPSRGRRGFEIKKNGEFIMYEIGRTDKPVKIVGHFKVESPNMISVYLKGRNPFSMRIATIENNGNILRIERK